MATQLPPLEPRLVQPPESEEITDGVYIIGWRLVRDSKDPNSKLDLEKMMNLSLTPAVEVASYPEIISLIVGAKTPVLVKNVITGIQPDGQYWTIRRKIDSDGRFTVKPFKFQGSEESDATTTNDNNKLAIQNIYIPPEWYIKRLTPGVPLFSIIEPGSERVWAYPKKGEKQVVLEEFATIMQSKELSHLLYMIKVADIQH